MDYSSDEPAAAAPQADATAAAELRRPILIALPFYKNEQLVAPVIGSLIACREELRGLHAEAVFYVDSPGYAPLDLALAEMLPRAQLAFGCRIERNPENLGFVRTMNKAVAEAVGRGMDLLLLNSDTVVEPGALTEMAMSLASDHMIGFVNPRSNNATIATLPVRGGAGMQPADYRAAAHDLTRRLPRFSYIPTAIGFCLLIRWNILAEFGGFDEVYGRGYNEENDLVMRASRCGYRVVMANRAFVWHQGEISFATADADRSVWEPANRAILDQRYPEYAGHTLAHYDRPETTAEALLACLTPDAGGKLDLGFDFSSFRTDHNGTFQAGLQLLQAAQVWRERYNIFVICRQDVYDFHGYGRLGIPRCDPHEARRFAAIFRVGQPYDWNVIERLAIRAAVIGIYMLDTISVDCPQLTSARIYNIWQFALEQSDLVVAQSRQTQAQFQARFDIPRTTRQIVARHSLDLRDYALPNTADEAGAAAPDADAGADRHGILVIGNHFHHKYLSITANALAAAFPSRPVTALGMARPAARPAADPMVPAPLADLPNLAPLQVGALTDGEIGARYAACAVVVFPSHAEGFGFPVLNALAARRPVFVRRLPVFVEVWQALGRTPNMHFYDTTAELCTVLADPPSWREGADAAPAEGVEHCARLIRDALDDAIAGADYARIVRRIRSMQLASDLSEAGRTPVGHAAHAAHAAKAAQFLALTVERAAWRMLNIAPVYHATRAAFRATRAGWRTVRTYTRRN